LDGGSEGCVPRAQVCTLDGSNTSAVTRRAPTWGRCCTRVVG
jgi:hypothetical protein